MSILTLFVMFFCNVISSINANVCTLDTVSIEWANTNRASIDVASLFRESISSVIRLVNKESYVLHLSFVEIHMCFSIQLTIF